METCLDRETISQIVCRSLTSFWSIWFELFSTMVTKHLSTQKTITKSSPRNHFGNWWIGTREFWPWEEMNKKQGLNLMKKIIPRKVYLVKQATNKSQMNNYLLPSWILLLKSEKKEKNVKSSQFLNICNTHVILKVKSAARWDSNSRPCLPRAFALPLSYRSILDM